MTDPNKLDKKTVHKDANPLVEQDIDTQQVSIKAWSQKLLVALLCVASFYGGWKSYESNMSNQCFASGGQVVDHGKTMLCELL